ncbi:MAG: serine--tRNA ligase [Deltaproteobacteria bacterium]|mgnify:CR=1 FL=1|nr:serine--tRNA ligase [Deltaproteobacteria bacterium]
MLDRRFITEQPDVVRASLTKRNADEGTLSALEQIIEMDQHRKSVNTETDELRATRNSLSRQIGPLMQQGKRDEAEPLKAQVKAQGDRLAALETQLKELEESQTALLMTIPNLLDERVPAGTSEDDNAVLRTWGEPKPLDFEAKDHHDIGTELGILDFPAAAKISGARFSVLTGAGARLERALINWFVDQGIDNGYREVMVPYIVSRSAMTGTGQLPKFEDDAFKVNHDVAGEDAFLISTAEIPVTNLHRDEIISEDDLPIKYVCFTPCFRAEAGSYGKDTRGLIRQHQFHKVEMVKIVTPESATEEHESLTRNAEELLQALGLPYRTMVLCGGDVGFTARICYDIEVWLPGQGAFREISSCSHFGDFQSRRAKIRYRRSEGGKPVLAHTINGSGLAVGRTLVAILENYQQADGSVIVPDVLRPYMGGLDRITAVE